MQDPRPAGSTPVWASPRFRLDLERWDTADGRVERPVIHHPGAVAVLAEPEPGQVLFVRQYRYPVRRWTLEIPAGTRVPGEPPERTAARELAEEVGLAAARLDEVLRFFPALGVSDEEMILYRAVGLSEAAHAPEPGELASRAVLARAEIPAACARGEICDAKTLIALALLGFPIASRP